MQIIITENTVGLVLDESIRCISVAETKDSNKYTVVVEYKDTPTTKFVSNVSNHYDTRAEAEEALIRLVMAIIREEYQVKAPENPKPSEDKQLDFEQILEQADRGFYTVQDMQLWINRNPEKVAETEEDEG